jgi:hypothetical protein
MPNCTGEAMATSYCQEMYAFPDSGKFSDAGSFAPADGIRPLAAVQPQEYYTRILAINAPDRVLEIPSNLETLLDRYWSSSEDEQERFIRACFWFYHARSVYADSRSAAFTEFLEQFAPATPTFQEARAKLYYEFRSRLAHGGALTYSDRSPVFGGLTPEAIEEEQLSTEVWRLVKLVLVNWLHTRCPLL